MQTFVPKYYFDFNCKADKCNHNCCIGWEIDIDNETYEKYRSLGGEFGARLIDNIEISNEETYFKLGDSERCPFLNKNNLCDIITELSETALCQICRDHPRFRNYFDDRIEMGLGLTCEEAARIVLTSGIEDALTLAAHNKSSDNNTPDILCFTELPQITEVLLNSDMTLLEKFRATLHICDGEFPNKPISEWISIYSNLECMDQKWKDILKLLQRNIDDISDLTEPEDKLGYSIPILDYARPILLNADLSILLTRLFAYFLYRHLMHGFENGRLGNYASFCVLNVVVIASIFRAYLETYGELTDEQITDIVRMYSSEIEYSDENTDILIKLTRIN